MSEEAPNIPETATAAGLSLELSRRGSLSREIPVIPGYGSLELLGSGAFGTVYKAEQSSTGQTVAVKVLFSVTDSFREEVDRLSKVSDHPHVVTLVDANLNHDPPYLVTPYLPNSLQDRVPEEPSKADLPQVTLWFEQIASALQFVHGRGILHCDLKPANILIGEGGQPRLVDFGQSVAVESEELRLGSFWYMPWQQARLKGEEGEVPHVGWDLHALGATIYVLLTGQLPRATKVARNSLSGLKTGKEKVERYRGLVKESELVPIRRLNPHVDSELAAIVEACLCQRVYSSASEIVEDLERRRRGQPIKARDLTLSYWFKLFLGRHKVSVGVGVLAATLLLTGLSAATFEVYQAKQARSVLVAQQYDMGLSMLEQGKASGLVWLAKACRDEPNNQRVEALRKGLSRQLRIVSPEFYRLPTYTAPSPSGTKAIWSKQDGTKVLINLIDGSTEQIPAQIRALNQDQKDTIRYRLDGIVLDPLHGRGGPATWLLPQFQSISPANENVGVALFVGKDSVMQVKRTEDGYEVLDNDGSVKLELPGKGHILSSPTFSYQGDVVVGWDDSRVTLYQRKLDWAPLELDSDFRSDQFCFSGNGERIAGHDGLSKIRIWDQQGEVLADFDVSGAVNQMTFDDSGELLVCATRDALLYGFKLSEKRRAWAPAEMEKSARWVCIQPSGRIVTMSDEVTVWSPPSEQEDLPSELDALINQVALRTGWVYDESARVRTLTREEYAKLAEGVGR